MDIRKAVRFGQAMAAWNCKFEGVRGGMYSFDPAKAEIQLLPTDRALQSGLNLGYAKRRSRIGL